MYRKKMGLPAINNYSSQQDNNYVLDLRYEINLKSNVALPDQGVATNDLRFVTGGNLHDY